MPQIGRFGLCLALGCCVWVAPAAAQDLVAPRVKSLPGAEVPAGVEVPESGVVRVLVRIDPDGKGVVEQCDAGRALCDVVIDAIAKAEFEPALRDGKPVPSEVRIDLRTREPAPDQTSDVASVEAVVEPGTELVEKELVFSETAQVDARAQAPIKLKLDGIRNIPGIFGEPFRTLELMPGTVPVANGQPYVYVRGAPPSGTQYIYDEIPIPLLFHSALGPATVHSGLIGGINLYSGAAPARYGRYTGAVVTARAPSITTRHTVEDRLPRFSNNRLSNIETIPLPGGSSQYARSRFTVSSLYVLNRG